MNESQTTIAAVLEGLTRQRQCAEALASLCRDQRQLVADGDAEGLLRLLGRRQGLIRELEAAEEQLADFKSAWPGSRERLPAERRPAVERLLAQIEDRLRTVIEHDETDYQRLSEAKDALGGRIRQAAAGRQVHAAYAAARRTGGLLPEGDSA